jgi:hypothetical protein
LKISELCKLIEESLRTGKYPFSSENEVKMSQRVQINSKSTTDSLKDENIIIEIKLDDFYVINNYNCKLSHLPGIIEIDSLDSFKMLSRRLSRIDKGIQNSHGIEFRPTK